MKNKLLRGVTLNNLQYSCYTDIFIDSTLTVDIVGDY